ncbi:MAG: hypothetical protein US76_00055 [Parcubacteria group bacterium GW2011_GWA2_38_13b]|nr:MAG: hypothetical protein US76_00055 [Parcubacteria group bacterium GW2011_GWA2_38_13b]
MINDFWKKLHKPILALAPMADVTDTAFRRIIAKYGKPDVMFTEFVSCDGLCSAGKKNLLPILKYSEKERPIVAQVFGANPENFYKSAKIITKLRFNGIDINMGCPDKKVLKQDAGAALINNPKLAQEIIRQTKKGAGNIPVSIKTRIGYDKYDKKEFKKWLVALLEEKPAAITIHARTKKEMSLVPAHWDIIAEAVKIRNKFDSSKNKTLILGNGDVKNIADAKEKAKISGADGVMIGRAIFGNPWLFANLAREKRECQINHPPKLLVKTDCAYITTEKKLQVLLEHAKLFSAIGGSASGGKNTKNFDIMKKHFKAYVTGFPRAKELRIKLMACKNADEAEKIIFAYL